MAPKSVWASDQNWLLVEPDGDYRKRSPSELFDGMSWTKVDEQVSAVPPTGTQKLYKEDTHYVLMDGRSGSVGECASCRAVERGRIEEGVSPIGFVLVFEV